MDVAKLRSFWAYKQGLTTPIQGTPEDVITRVGWFRSVGGSSPYLGLYARSGLLREDVDAALAQGSIGELPSARGCTYVLPKAHYDMGLRLALPHAERQIASAAKPLALEESELARLEGAVVASLKESTKDPQDLKMSVGSFINNLGELGKKKGLSSTLPLALGRLQAQGLIQRIPKNGRLDQQRYSYRAIERDKPIDSIPFDSAVREVAKLFWQWIGPARLRDFEWFSGLNKGQVEQIAKDVNLAALEDGWFTSPDEVPLFEKFEPQGQGVHFLGCLDNLFLLRRDLKTHLAETDTDQRVPTEKGEVAVGSLMDLESHAIVRGGQLIGVWDFDPNLSRLYSRVFEGSSEPVQAAGERVRRMIIENLDDVRSFSLDSPTSRQAKLSQY